MDSTPPNEENELITITKKAGRRFRHLEAGVARFEATVDEFAADSDPANLQNLDSQQLLSLWRRFINIRSHWTDAAMADAASMIYYRLTGMFLSREFTSEEDQAMVNRLLSGLCDIVSGLPTEKLWDLSRKIRASERLSRSFTIRLFANPGNYKFCPRNHLTTRYSAQLCSRCLINNMKE